MQNRKLFYSFIFNFKMILNICSVFLTYSNKVIEIEDAKKIFFFYFNELLPSAHLLAETQQYYH